jgi:hypothetical protein
MTQSRNGRFHIIAMFNCLKFLAALPAPRRGDRRRSNRRWPRSCPKSCYTRAAIVLIDALDRAFVLARAGAPLPQQTDGEDRKASVPHAL